MKIQSNLLLILLIFFAVQYSCKKDSTLPPVDMGYDYFPTTQGKWIIYQVDSIHYNDFTNTSDTFHFQIKEFIESKFLDGNSRQSERIERSSRIDNSQPWTLSNVWFSTLTNSRAERNEENIKYIKLTFPITVSSNWDANAFNTLEKQECRYKDLYKTFFVDSLRFDSTITVQKDDFLTFIGRDFEKEVYAKHIGMIYREAIHVEWDSNQKITKGVNYKYRIVSYGIN